MSLWDIFDAHNGKKISKWKNYFSVYERYFQPWKNKTFTFLEIGVQGGGSLQMWNTYFGSQATIIGIDTNANCQQHEDINNNIHVRIGDQKDTVFLQNILDEFGIPDIVLDDGSHLPEDQRSSFEFLYPKLLPTGCYLIEDAHTSYWANCYGGLNEPGAFINYSKRLIDQLNADWTEGAIVPDDFTRQTNSISFYDSMVVFEKGLQSKNTIVNRGRDF
jgi:cephalosporin hydroxylase